MNVVLSLVLYACAGFAAGIFVVMLYSVAVFRSAAASSAAAFRRSATVEVLWAFVPILIMIGAAAPAISNALDVIDAERFAQRSPPAQEAGLLSPSSPATRR